MSRTALTIDSSNLKVGQIIKHDYATWVLFAEVVVLGSKNIKVKTCYKDYKDGKEEYKISEQMRLVKRERIIGIFDTLTHAIAVSPNLR